MKTEATKDLGSFALRVKIERLQCPKDLVDCKSYFD